MLASLKAAGAVGLAVGLLGFRVIGIAAAIGLVLFFVGAMAAHFRARVFTILPFPVPTSRWPSLHSDSPSLSDDLPRGRQAGSCRRPLIEPACGPFEPCARRAACTVPREPEPHSGLRLPDRDRGRRRPQAAQRSARSQFPSLSRLDFGMGQRVVRPATPRAHSRRQDRWFRDPQHLARNNPTQRTPPPWPTQRGITTQGTALINFFRSFQSIRSVQQRAKPEQTGCG
ncbi:DoxX family protein [Streptomyces sp. NBC_00984]|uniref:DoxX family protein n=1 Tax=Streptomyces sp. NBC_00984 TaxID=2903700 RepID=UPI0038647E33